MAKIHTHYDNLKVARMAPQEVIRAAYKALSQKYHPDKNPGDEKSARIMAIVNSAYGILSDPERRKEHDEWIAAEEWEIAWLESTRAEESREKPRAEAPVTHSWDPPPGPPPPYRATRDPAWWFGIGIALSAGLAGGILIMNEPNVLPRALASALGAHEPGGEPAPALPLPLAIPAPAAAPVPSPAPAAADDWATGARGPSRVRALGVTQLVVPPRVPNCDTELHTLVAPNGEPWPENSGYVTGYPLSNQGAEMEVRVDNSGNSSPVFVKLYDLDRRSNVRHVYVQAGETLTVDKLSAGKYEVRYQNIEIGGSAEQCAASRAPTAVVQADDIERTTEPGGAPN
ncbi:MAG: J domain-containing protein [Pseudomonadota bacterium]